MPEPIFFDASLPMLAETVAASLGNMALSAGVVLRDTTGRLAFFSAAAHSEQETLRLDAALRAKLGAYARSDQTFFGCTDFGAEAVLADASVLSIRSGEHLIRLIDRRLVGADWMRPPLPAIEDPAPARFVFASLKGGVGRSTALSVAAAHLAARGGRVLAVDLDLEAPGLGSVLLTHKTLPEFGVVDVLVENGLQELDDSFYADLVGPCSLAVGGGRIDVMPAFGARSRANPAEVLAKLSRAYTEDIATSGAVATIRDQVSSLIERYASPQQYDAIFVDARAGLNETSASAVTGLGAEVFLFGRDEEQSFEGYSFLFGHLSRLIPPYRPSPEWTERLTPVQAFAPVDSGEREAFRVRWEEMVRRSGLIAAQAEQPSVLLPDGFSEIPWADDERDENVLPNESSLLAPIAILRDQNYEGFNPFRRQDLLSKAIYAQAFGELLTRIDDAVATTGRPP